VRNPVTVPISPSTVMASDQTQPSDKLRTDRTDTDNHQLVQQLLEIGQALSGSHNLDDLLNLILTGSRQVTASDAGSIYLIDRTKEDCAELIFKIAQNDSVANLALREFRMPLSTESLAGYVATTGRSLNIPDAYNLEPSLPYQIDRRLDRDFNYRTVSVLVLPMRNQEGETIGVLQLINSKQSPEQNISSENALTVTRPYSLWEEQIVTALASQAAISIERNHLQESIEELLSGFVRASVRAIEARDPATAGHSDRVAALTVRLAIEAHAENSGSLSNVAFSDRQLQEIRYASLLHDFGKVSVPESILQKEKKLYPSQLQEIHQRLLILQGQWQLDCAQHRFNGNHQSEPHCPHCQQQTQLDIELHAKLERLHHHWQLVQNLNEPQVTVQRLASMDDIAQDLQEMAGWKYRDLLGQWQPVLTAAEIEQLLIPRGTLSSTERDRIQLHVVHTYDFLRQIPWTKHLQNVPAIAGSHHEKLDGSGYPWGLKEAEIPIQSQMMAIADIYDALAASDRPYKPRLSIERSLEILQQEAQANKLNQDLLDLFRQRQVYLAIEANANSQN
jgi:HD-GYP domain-containing protein (c-di-GMP phosphodiesterase class II)